MTLDDPDDRRAYFQRIVDDIKDQIRDGRLDVSSPIPSAREMAVMYGVASMTAQRALRELQQLRLTYGVPGRGTFVHPDAVDLLRGKLMREPVGEDDPQLRRRVADYLATQDQLFRRFHTARTTAERDQIVTDLVRHADQHRDLIDQMAPLPDHPRQPRR
jgi:DNA-binding transcriptional regulator YhcF (GntR family)